MMKNYFKTIMIFSLIFLASGINPAFAQWPKQGVVYEGRHMMGAGMGWTMFLFWGIILSILLLAILWVCQLPKKEQKDIKSTSSAMDILKKKFTEGKIDITEFESKKQAISE